MKSNRSDALSTEEIDPPGSTEFKDQFIRGRLKSPRIDN